MKPPYRKSETKVGKSGDASSHSGAEKTSQPLSRRRLWLFRFAAMLLVPAVFFLATELGLRVVGYGYNPDFFLKRDIGRKAFFVQNEDFSRRFFPPETMRQPNAMRMHAEKPAGMIRIFVLGESAAMGDPEPAYGPARYLEVLLQQRFPDREFEIVNVAFTAINSHVLLPLAKECAKHDGDVWIIYMGNNEMVGPYGAATILGTQAPPRLFIQLVTAIQRTRIGQLGMEIVRKVQKPSTKSGSWGGMAMFQNQRVAPQSPKKETVYDNFAANLNAMLRCGLDSGAKIILNTVAVNLRDSPPFASLPDETLSPESKRRFDGLFRDALKAQEAKNWTNAAVLFGQALEIDGSFAEAHYRRALCLEQAAQFDTARKHYQLACDMDALPFRTDSRENALIREIATRRANDKLLLVDAPVAMATNLTAGQCGQELFYEHVHFNFDGGYRLGLTWAQAVVQMLAKDRSYQSTNEWASQFSCERRLGLTDWNRRFVLQSMIRRLNAPPLNLQFNHTERLQRISTYEQFLSSTANAETAKNAQATLAEAVAARPDDHFVIEAYAAFLQATGDMPGTIREWRKVSELLPHDFLPWFQMGVIQSKLGNYAESESHLRKALELRPGLVEGWNELGQCLGALQNWQPALDAFEHASKLRPEEPVFWAFRAKVLVGLRRNRRRLIAIGRRSN
jgi:tetratricopeptide (TPR) repeat protein